MTCKLAEDGIAHIARSMFRASKAGREDEAIATGEAAISTIRTMVLDIYRKRARKERENERQARS